MPGQYPAYRGMYRRQLLVVQSGLVIDGCVPAGEQQRVAFPQRNVEPLGEAQHHLPARHRPPGLHETQVARGNTGMRRQFQLTQPPAHPPVPQQFADPDTVPHRTEITRGPAAKP